MKATKTQRILNELADGEIRNYYIGSKQHTRKSTDHVGQTIEVLDNIGLKTPLHYRHGNDAPKGGWQGYYVRLTYAGKQLKVVKEAIRICLAEQQKKEEKQKQISTQEAKEQFPIVCKERLSDGLSNNRKKRLNSQIRYYANQLNLTIPNDNFVQFVQKHVSI